MPAITLTAKGLYKINIQRNGKRYSLYGKDKKTVKEKLKDLERKLDNGLDVNAGKMTVSNWYAAWMKDYKQGTVKQGTLDSYDRIFENYICPAIGKKKLCDLTAADIQHLYKSMSDAGRSKATISLTAAVISGFVKQAYKLEMIQKNICDLTTMPKTEPKAKERKAMTAAEQALFLSYSAQSDYSDILTVLLFTGARIGELRALQWKDVDLINGTITICGTLKYHSGSGYYIDTPKTTTSQRIIPLLPNVKDILKKRSLEQKKMQLFLGKEWTPTNGLENLVFTSASGRLGFGHPISVSCINTEIKRICDTIRADGHSIINVTPHTLRHTCATRLFENGAKPKAIQTILGHSTLAMTMDIYAECHKEETAAELMKMLG